MTSFFLPVALIQSRTRSSSQEFKPVRSMGIGRVDRLYLLDKRLTLGEGGRERVGTLKILAPFASMTVFLTTVSLEWERTASSCRY